MKKEKIEWAISTDDKHPGKQLTFSVEPSPFADLVDLHIRIDRKDYEVLRAKAVYNKSNTGTLIRNAIKNSASRCKCYLDL